MVSSLSACLSPHPPLQAHIYHHHKAQTGRWCLSQPGLCLVPKGKAQHEHLAPTICASITQFDSVVNSVITTCLGGLTKEHWTKELTTCYEMPSRVPV